MACKTFALAPEPRGVHCQPALEPFGASPSADWRVFGAPVTTLTPNGNSQRAAPTARQTQQATPAASLQPSLHLPEHLRQRCGKLCSRYEEPSLEDNNLILTETYIHNNDTDSLWHAYGFSLLPCNVALQQCPNPAGCWELSGNDQSCRGLVFTPCMITTVETRHKKFN